MVELTQNLVLLKRAVNSGDYRIVSRVLRQTPTFRRKLTSDILVKAIDSFFQADTPNRDIFLSALKKIPTPDVAPMETTPTTAPGTPATPSTEDFKGLVPESELYLSLLVLTFLVDNKAYSDAVNVSAAIVQRLHTFNRRSLDLIAAKIYFYYARAFELAGRLSECRSVLLSSYRTATLRHDDVNQAMLLNLLLRNYLHYNLYEQADLLVSKTTFPANATNNQTARYMYYIARIKAVQLAYSDAYINITQALRKGPTTSGRGFRLAATKLSVIIELLMGSIPERSIFNSSGLRTALVPYLQLTQAVRVGDLRKFQEVVDQNQSVFKADKTYTLILRLRQTVIKTGLRKISLAYSCISFTDISNKLHLEGAEVAEGTVAKAIADGVIKATIDHDGGFMRASQSADVYSTQQPTAQYHKRIEFCSDIHQQAIKAMTFPADLQKAVSESAEARRQRLLEEQEIAQSMAEDEEEDGDF